VPGEYFLKKRLVNSGEKNEPDIAGSLVNYFETPVRLISNRSMPRASPWDVCQQDTFFSS
jgi:hypothetical protein